MPAFDRELFPILFGDKWPDTGLAAAISEISNDLDRLCDEYKRLQDCAPRRYQRNKQYFTGHCGTLSKRIKQDAPVRRYEEHLAVALFNEEREWTDPRGGAFRLRDYQFPLKSKQSDEGIGKIDLLGVADKGQLMVIELKVHPKDTGRGDSPMRALMEALRYTAVVQANQADIVAEAKTKSKSGIEIRDIPPVIWIVGTEAWWRGWSTGLAPSTRKALGDWESEFARLCRNINQHIGIEINCVALQGTDRGDIDYGPNRDKPRLKGELQLCSVSLDDGRNIKFGPPVK